MRNIFGQDEVGEFKVVVPDNARLTYGPNVPYASKSEKFASRVEGYALRVYEGDKILATFTNVKWFRDESIKIWRVVEKESGQTLWKSDQEGYEVTKRVNKTSELVDVSRQLENKAQKAKRNRE